MPLLLCCDHLLYRMHWNTQCRSKLATLFMYKMLCNLCASMGIKFRLSLGNDLFLISSLAPTYILQRLMQERVEDPNVDYSLYGTWHLSQFLRNPLDVVRIVFHPIRTRRGEQFLWLYAKQVVLNTRARQRSGTMLSKRNVLSGGSNCTSTTMRWFRVLRYSFQATRGGTSYSRYL
jgi:hypothetical protein